MSLTAFDRDPFDRYIYLAVQQQDVRYNLFPIDMKNGSPSEQEEAVRDKPAASLDIVALALFGDGETLRDLTRKCSLFRG